MKFYALRSRSFLAGHKIRAPFRLLSLKSRIVAALCVAAVAFFVGGCEEKKGPAPDDKVLFQAIEDNANALNKKDIDAVLATIHPKAKSFSSVRGDLEGMFRMVEGVTLKITMSDMKVKEASPEEARVSFAQKTEQVIGDHSIPLNVLEEVDILRPDDGKWKIFETEVTKTTKLNEIQAGSAEPAAPSPARATPAPAATPVRASTPAPAATPGATEAKPATPAEKPQ